MEKPSETEQFKGKDWLMWIIPVVLSVWVTVMTWFHTWIEEVYSIKIYPYIAQFQRIIIGWLPFSLGDILYFLAGLWLFVTIGKTIIAVFKKRITKHKTIRRAFRFARLLMWIYIIFNLVWGWNYHRKGFEYQLELSVNKYSSAEVKQVLDEVIVKMNETRRTISTDTILPAKTFEQLQTTAKESFDAAAAKWPFLQYSNPSIKKSLYSSTAKYFGFTGYYNPFSGEAQLRTEMPDIMKPFVTCHEIGHQLGYAKEDEASFAGYLAAMHSKDPYFRYSVYMDMYIFLNANYIVTALSQGDTSVLRTYIANEEKLDTLVRFDRKKIYQYFKIRETFISKKMSSLVMNVYGQYLKANSQSLGLKSYDQVVSLLIAYRRKYGEI